VCDRPGRAGASVTPAMRAAGLAAFHDEVDGDLWDTGFVSDGLLDAVFLAMLEAQKET
jgi:hypothetical protein